MKLYRYFSDDFGTQLMREGKVRLGTFAKYHKMELDEADTVRGDKDDGRKFVAIDQFTGDGQIASPIVQMLTGATNPPGITFENCLVSFHSDNLLVLCMSQVLSVEVAQEFAYATECVQINEPDWFFATITKALRRAKGRNFDFLGWFPCSYVSSRTMKHTDDTAHIQDQYVLKHESYQRQQEVRALWRYNPGSLEGDHIDLVCPKIGRYCSLVDFRVHAGSGYSYKVFWS